MPELSKTSVRSPEPNTTVITTDLCMYCYKPGEVAVPTKDYVNFRETMFMQDAFPTLSAAQREQLISGIHPKCWDKMFPSEEEEINEFQGKQL